ncbi:MAG TPA: right-handed parallel beta-helix repeat-containing protein, partial [Thermoanaerobaculia bacterium]|nr:right-handed parallel beta-helix repeat-containing protein [Thermoanaerobaculia bacterium]
MLRFPIPVLLLFLFAWTAAQAGEQRWYVDSSAAPGGDGSASAPYASLASVASRTEPGLIVLRSSRTHYQGPVRLHPGQSLRGEGAERPVVTSSSDVVTVEGGDGEVVVSDVVILGTGTAAGMTIAPTDAAVSVRDVRIETAGGTALSASGVRRLKIQRAAIVTSNAPTAVEIHDSELDAEIQSVSARGNTLRSAIVLDDISGRVVIEGGAVEGGTASAVSASNVANLTLRRMVLKGNARTNGAEASACGGDGDDLAVSCHAAIALRNVAGAILENVSIEDSGQAGIVASGVRGLKISDTMIAGSGDELFEHAMIVAGGSGDYVLDNVRITRSASRHLMIRGGEDLRFKISRSSFSETAPPHGQQAILLHAGDADSVELAVRDSVFTDTFSNAIDVIGSGDARIGVTVEGNQFHRQAAAVNIAATERATIEYVVAQNPAIHGSSG